MNTQTTEPVPVSPAAKREKSRLVWGIVCLMGPTVLVVVTILLYALINFIAGSADTTRSSLFDESSMALTIANVVMFSVGAISMLTWLPGIVIGIALLLTRKKV